MDKPKFDFEDAKTQFLVKLANFSSEIGLMLAEGNDGDAMRLLGSLLAMIQVDETEKELKALQKKFVYEYQTFVPMITGEQSHKYFFMLSEYLNKTYFKDFKGFHGVDASKVEI
jgi:hypothetical protein